MSETQNSLPASRAEPESLDSAMNALSGQLAGAAGDSCDEFGIDQSNKLGAHRLLSPPIAPQGRRSLFRR